MKDKQFYVAPTMLVVEVKTKGILCTSGGETSDGVGHGFSEGWDS
jgi:hypothetical protein